MTKSPSSRKICRHPHVGKVRVIAKDKVIANSTGNTSAAGWRSSKYAKVGISYSQLRTTCYQLAVEDLGQLPRSVTEKRLTVALERLRGLLQAMPPSTRQERIATLDAVVRAALLGFMEGRRLECTPKILQRQTLQDVMKNDSKPHRMAKSAEKTVVLPGSGVLGVHRGKGGLYRAKTSIDGVILYSRYASLDVAASYQNTLVQFRRSVAARLQLLAEEETRALMGESCPEKVFTLPMPPGRLRGAFLAALADASVSIAFAEAGVRMYLSLHVAKWLGSVHVTSPVVSAVEVLSLRERLLSARMLGWEAFRQAWIELLQIQAARRCRRRGASAVFAFAEAHVESAFRRNSATGAQRQEFHAAEFLPSHKRTSRMKSTSVHKIAGARRSSLWLGRLERRFEHTVKAVVRILAQLRRGTKRRR